MPHVAEIGLCARLSRYLRAGGGRYFHRLGASRLDRMICASAGGAALMVNMAQLGSALVDFGQTPMMQSQARFSGCRQRV